jgi:hypothetical protein
LEKLPGFRGFPSGVQGSDLVTGSGEISGDVFSFCYTQAGAVHDGMLSSVISCTEVRRLH